MAAEVSVPARRGGTRAGAAARLDRVDIWFGGFHAVAEVSMDVAPGEFVCLLGPSGCGKSTLLSALAGFLVPSSGAVTVDGAPVAGPGPDLGMVFQSSEALFDWQSVRRNVTFGPRMRGVGRADQAAIADEYLGLVGLRHCADKLPDQLSGGMRQRVQFARVLANQPRVLLMDEPFGALDAQTRLVLQREMDRIRAATGCTVVFVTHDIGEAITLADRVLVMTAGPAARIKSEYPVELTRPRDETSAGFLALQRRLRQDIGDEVRAALRDQGLDQGLNQGLDQSFDQGEPV
jgi:NitT/TauT family transport system ATP-binding protein